MRVGPCATYRQFARQEPERCSGPCPPPIGERHRLVATTSNIRIEGAIACPSMLWLCRPAAIASILIPTEHAAEHPDVFRSRRANAAVLPAQRHGHPLPLWVHLDARSSQSPVISIRQRPRPPVRFAGKITH
ncbi:hypothetical protein P280DRAFT_60435 [Massarina eburnea CBS 473.64]|uniref:Uncharacterized protein n=1 Tax=Massarina eburnea CBS 473.64 TaxID=1395130 RepID=A0A6A6RWJ0_9PLEO|nr:hypothetical protein P280DRAFT_60435 [Massarina eburnea CBS 473.64]